MAKMINNQILNSMLALVRTLERNFQMIKNQEKSYKGKVIGRNINVSEKKKERKRNSSLKKNKSKVKLKFLKKIMMKNLRKRRLNQSYLLEVKIMVEVNSNQIQRIKDLIKFLRIKNSHLILLTKTTKKLLMENSLKNKRSKEEKCMMMNEKLFIFEYFWVKKQ